MMGDLEGLVFFVPFLYLGLAGIAYLYTRNKFQP
jgi:hypothetical protein